MNVTFMFYNTKETTQHRKIIQHQKSSGPSSTKYKTLNKLYSSKQTNYTAPKKLDKDGTKANQIQNIITPKAYNT
jgi:hypothetical protein